MSSTSSPIIANRSPAPGATGVANDALISFDLYDKETFVSLSSINVDVKGDTAFSAGSFIAPFDGPSSALSTTIVDGYDAYHIVIDSTELLSNSVLVEVTADDYGGNTLTSSWSFLVEGDFNVLYFSDGYGLKSVDIQELVGESQDAVQTVLSTTTSPSIPVNFISYIHGNQIDGYNYLALSLSETFVAVGSALWGSMIWGSFFWGGLGSFDDYGAAIIKNETEVNIYADGYFADKAQINDDGTLYLINKTLNQIEVYYGADIRPGAGRSPDFIYNTTSTPSVFSGTITELHLVSGASSVSEGSSRIYIGTTEGVSRIDTYDRELTGMDGYSSGMEAFGSAITYGIVGSGADFESIGGTVPEVVSISSDDDRLIFFVATDDGYGNGGLTQINLSGNTKILFINEATGMIPSNSIRDIFGKGF